MTSEELFEAFTECIMRSGDWEELDEELMMLQLQIINEASIPGTPMQVQKIIQEVSKLLSGVRSSIEVVSLKTEGLDQYWMVA